MLFIFNNKKLMRYDLDNQYALDNSSLIVFAQMTNKKLALRIF